MTAITNDLRNAAVQKATAFGMEKDYLKLNAMKTQFADAWYEKNFGKEAQQMLQFEFSNKWLTKTQSIIISAVGFRHKNYNHEAFETMHSEFQLSQEVPMPVGGCILYVPKDEKRPRELDAIHVYYQELWNKKERMEVAVRGLLQSVNTYKQLKAIWPDGMRFLPPEPAKSRAVITVGTVEALNKVIGLPPGEE